MKKDSKLFKILINLDIVIVSTAPVTSVGRTFTDAIARYVVGKSFGWIEEIQTAFIVWTVFAAGGAAYRTGSHSTIEISYEMFLKPVRKIVSTFIGLVVTVALGLLYYTGIDYLQLFIHTGRAAAVPDLLFTWIHMIVPVSRTPQIFNYFFASVFGYGDEVERLVEGDEDE